MYKVKKSPLPPYNNTCIQIDQNCTLNQTVLNNVINEMVLGKKQEGERKYP